MSAAAPRPSIVLVHGAFADGSCWRRVIPLLHADRFDVTAVQLGLTSLDADAAIVRRVLEAQPGPVVAVGHSYGGAVITQAAAGVANVASLVYMAAFAPDGGERGGELLARFGVPPLATALVPDAAGFVTIDRDRFHEVFAADLPDDEARVLACSQGPVAATCFQDVTGAPAWRERPSWYLVARQDGAIPSELQKFMANRMGAHVIEVDSSHLPLLSRPGVVADVIRTAASATP